jgi:hypothetical protein
VSELEIGAGGGGDVQISRSEVSVTGSNTHPIPSIPTSVSHTVPSSASSSVPLPAPAPLADVPLTAVDADRIVQSDYLSPYCTEIAIRYDYALTYSPITFHFDRCILYVD